MISNSLKNQETKLNSWLFIFFTKENTS